MGFLKNKIKAIGELVGVVVLVLLFFSVFISTLNVMFPTGASLSDMMDKGGVVAPIQPGGKENEGVSAEEQPVVLSRLENMVKNKRSDDIEWTAAQLGLNLHNRDAIQTFKAASAQLTIDKGENYLEIGENSLVIISRNEKDTETNEKRSLLVILDGELKGKIAQTSQERLSVEVSTPNAMVRIHTEQQGQSNAEFKVAINPDRSSTFTVLKGAAEVMAQGKSVEVRENQSTTVLLNEPPPSPNALPRGLTLTDPVNEQVVYYREIPPRIRFAWLALPDAGGYRFLLARDRDFRDIVVDEWVDENGFVHGNLKEGDYFWKVGLRDGSICETRQLHIVRVTKPPMIRLQPIPKVVHFDRYVIKGSTDPNARIIVGGRDVVTDGQGGFKYNLRLQHGINIIVIEAVDKAGNIGYSTVKMYAKFK